MSNKPKSHPDAAGTSKLSARNVAMRTLLALNALGFQTALNPRAEAQDKPSKPVATAEEGVEQAEKEPIHSKFNHVLYDPAGDVEKASYMRASAFHPEVHIDTRFGTMTSENRGVLSSKESFTGVHAKGALKYTGGQKDKDANGRLFHADIPTLNFGGTGEVGGWPHQPDGLSVSFNRDLGAVQVFFHVTENGTQHRYRLDKEDVEDSKDAEALGVDYDTTRGDWHDFDATYDGTTLTVTVGSGKGAKRFSIVPSAAHCRKMNEDSPDCTVPDNLTGHFEMFSREPVGAQVQSSSFTLDALEAIQKK